MFHLDNTINPIAPIITLTNIFDKPALCYLVPMNDANILIQLLLTAIMGVIAAWVMHAFMLAISHHHRVPVNLVEALGSLLTGKLEGAKRTGLIVHTIGGAIMGMLYGIVIWQIGLESAALTMLAGGILGLFHGLVACFSLMLGLDELHPVEKYQQATLSVGFTHLVGHVVFGIVLALLILLV